MIRFAKILSLLMFMSIQLIGFFGSVMAADTIADLPTANTNWFELIPKVDKDDITKTYDAVAKWVKKDGNRHQFWDKYNEEASTLAKGKDGVAKQLATWVMNWDTIIAYSSIVITFISNLWLVVWAGFIIYSGYQYAMSAFGTKEDNGKAIKNAFIGIAVIAMSYGIFRLLARIFIE